MDMITLAMAKAYTDSKQLASVETTLTKVLEGDGSSFISGVDVSLIEPGTPCIVKVCGETYETTAYGLSGGNVGVGNRSLDNNSGSDTGEPFYIIVSSGFSFVTIQSGYSGMAELYVKTETIHPIDPKYLPEGGVGNTETSETVVLSEITVNGIDPAPTFQENLIVGETYIVKYDGVLYECEAKKSVLYAGVGIGDDNLYLFEEPTSGFPFLVCTDDMGNCVYAWDQDTSHTISVIRRAEIVHPIDPKFIPAMDSITLNGADGKQYKLTVENGALKVTAVV